MTAEFFYGAPIIVRLPGIPQPELPPLGNSYIYFDSGTNLLMASQNGGAYVPLIGGGGSAPLSTVLGIGNTTGPFDISVNGGQKIVSAAASALTLDGTTTLDLQTGAATRWQVNASGHLVPGTTDNLEDIGAAATNRVRTLYAGTSVVVGATVTINGATNTISSSADLTLASAAAFDLVLTGRSAPTNLNQAGQTALNATYTGVGRTSLIGALNALVDGTVTPTASTLSAVLAVGNTTGANNISVNGGQKIVSAAASTLTLDGTTTLDLQTGATTRWQVSAAGHLLPGTTDNAEDIGASATNRIRTLYAGTSVVVGATVTINGTTNTISSSANLTLDTGVAGTMNFGTTNATTVNVGSGALGSMVVNLTPLTGTLTVNGNLAVNGTTTTINTTNLTVTDALIYANDGGSNPSFAGLAWDQGAALDVIMVWNPTDTRIEFGRFNTVGGTVLPAGALATLTDIRANNVTLAGTTVTADAGLTVAATAATLNLAATGANVVQITTNGASRWNVNSNGHLLANTDNTVDIGATGATRPRRVYVGTEVVVGNTITIGSATIASSTTLGITSADGTGGGAGSALAILAGSGNGAGAGGIANFTAGAGGATGNGAAASVTGGAGGSTSGNGGQANLVGGTPTDGNGGSVLLLAQNGVGTNRNGGNVSGQAGAATGSGTAGNLQFGAGNGGTISAGGNVVILAGTGGVTNGNGGTATLSAGDASGSGTGGTLNLSGGLSPSGTGGELKLQTGNAVLADRVRVLPTGLVGVGSGTPLSTLDVQGSLGFGVTSISANTTADATASVWLVDASGGAVTLTLPTAGSASRRTYNIKKTDSSLNAVTVDGAGAETIDGALTQTLIAQYESIMIVSDGASWYIL